MNWLDRIRKQHQRSTLGKSDIPWWLGLIFLLGIIYLSSIFPSELKPLSVLGTVPYSGEQDVPPDTTLVIHFGLNGFQDTLGDLEPLVVIRYDDEDGPRTISTTVTYQGDILRAVPLEPLPAGERVEAAIRTQFDRDLIWAFTVTDDPLHLPSTPLPPFE